MVLAVISLLLLGQEKKGVLWRNFEEVFDLAADGQAVLAATNGGLLREGVPVDSPSGLRTIECVRPLIVGLADGRRLRLEGTRWVPTAEGVRPRDLSLGMILDPGNPWPLGEPPPAHPYAALRAGATDYAGTADGLYQREQGVWTRVRLPSDLPLARPNGIAQVGRVYVVGGLGGLFVGRPGAWRPVSDAAIRQVATVGVEVWAVHGDGAVDKVDPLTDRLYPDVLSGNTRRPWTSCVGANVDQPLFGGQGGWAERGEAGRYPTELKDDVATAITGRASVRWVGTQKTGLLRFDGRGVRRWNPGNGLPDTWVTALALTPTGLLVGTARRGLFRVVGDRISSVKAPTDRVTAVTHWQGRAVVGGMDGAWVAVGQTWRPLATKGEETTSLNVLRDGLAVTTAAGVYFFAR